MPPFMDHSLTTADELEPANPSRREQFRDFMRAHRARLVAELRDFEGAPVQIYWLDW